MPCKAEQISIRHNPGAVMAAKKATGDIPIVLDSQRLRLASSVVLVLRRSICANLALKISLKNVLKQGFVVLTKGLRSYLLGRCAGHNCASALDGRHLLDR